VKNKMIEHDFARWWVSHEEELEWPHRKVGSGGLPGMASNASLQLEDDFQSPEVQISDKGEAKNISSGV
jgi:hypothetical protein